MFSPLFVSFAIFCQCPSRPDWPIPDPTDALRPRTAAGVRDFLVPKAAGREPLGTQPSTTISPGRNRPGRLTGSDVRRKKTSRLG